MKLLLSLSLIIGSTCVMQANQTVFSTTSFRGIAYIPDSNMFVLGRIGDNEAQFLMDFQSLSQTEHFCSLGKQLLFMDYIRGTDHWVVGCEDEVQIRSMNGLKDSYQLPGSQTLSKFSLSYPYLDIHYNPTNIFSCRVDNLLLENCQEILVPQSQILNFRSLATAGYQMWTKILVYTNSITRIFIYSHFNSHCMEIDAWVYSVAQVNYTLYLWSSKGVYSYDHEQNTGLEFLVDWPDYPMSKRTSLAYVSGCLVFVNNHGQLKIHELDTNTTYQYDGEQTWRLYSYDDGVIVFQSGRGMRLAGNHHAQLPVIQPIIPWSKTEQYLWLPLENYTSTHSSYIVPDINNQTNSTNSTNSTNNTNNKQPERKSLRRSICWENCDLCRYNVCIVCSMGYTLENGVCEAEIPFTLLTTLESYPYSNIAFRMILLQFMEELWFYEYHQYNYSQPVCKMLRYIGNVNRNRYIPPYVKDALPHLYQQYLQSKHEWGFTNASNFTTKQYQEKEKEPINFSLNASKMYVWNYILCLIIYSIQRMSYCLLSRYQPTKNVFKRTSVGWVLVMILVEGHIQYISFLFFQQVKQQPSAFVFQDKINLIVAVMFMFVALVYTVGSFAIFSHLLGKKKFKVLVPNTTKNKLADMVVLILLGPGRNLLLGFVQAFNENFPLQMMFLLLMNAFTLIFIHYLHRRYEKPCKLKFRFVFIATVMVFVACGLLNHYSLLFLPSTFDVMQLVCMSGLLVLCILDFLMGFVTFIVEGILFLCRQCDSNPPNNTKKKERKSKESKDDSRRKTSNDIS